MIKGFAHVCITTTDLEATERFYCSGLGFTRAFRFIRGGESIGFYLKAAQGAYIEVFRRNETDPPVATAIPHFCLEVENIAELHRHLQAKGYEVTEPRLGADQSWQMWITDPGGVRIEFHQYTGQSSQITGNDCILD